MDELLTFRASQIIDPKCFERRALSVGRTILMAKNINS